MATELYVSIRVSGLECQAVSLCFFLTVNGSNIMPAIVASSGKQAIYTFSANFS